MSTPEFSRLLHGMLKAGIAPRHAHRAVEELEAHYEDIVYAAVEDGASQSEARHLAEQRLGDLGAVQTAMEAQPALRSWAWRWPRVALIVYPAACLLALPAVPMLAGVRYAPEIARWTACLLLGGLVTASMILFLGLAVNFA